MLSAIEDGTFRTKVRNGSIYSASEIHVAINNSNEERWWGTTGVAETDDGWAVSRH